jgi:hypothetical protein
MVRFGLAMLQPMLPICFESVDEVLLRPAEAKAIFPVCIIWLYFNLDGLSDHLVHVSRLGGEDGGVLDFNVVALVYAVLGYGGFVCFL